MSTRKFLLIIFLLVCPKILFAQGVEHTNFAWVLSSGNAPLVLPGATVTVCDGTTLPATGVACSPTTTIYSSPALASSSNPLTADAGGNFSFWGIPGNSYVISVSAVGVSTYSYSWTAPLGNPVLVDVIHTGTETFNGPLIPPGDSNENLYIGTATGAATTSGTGNTAVGWHAFEDNTTGSNNTAVGANALDFNTTGHGNVAFGDAALQYNTTAINNAAFGAQTLQQNTTGFNNTGIGNTALQINTTGSFNTAVGVSALGGNTTGSESSAVGNSALILSNGGANDAFGFQSLTNLTTGIFNIAIGHDAGINLTGAESHNIYIGNGGVLGESGIIRIGTPGTHTATHLSGTVNFWNAAATFYGSFTNSNTANRTYTLPDASGTMALQSTLTLKTGSASNYTGANTTYAAVDTTNLCAQITVPTGWKLLVSASGVLESVTAAVAQSVALADAGVTCTTGGVTALNGTERTITPPALGVFDVGFQTQYVLTGDGAAHSIALVAKTANGSDNWGIQSTSVTIAPSMSFLLMPSN